VKTYVLFIFNWIGVVCLAVGFGAMAFFSHATGIKSEPKLMLVLGPVSMVVDLAYRLLRRDRDLVSPTKGGQLFFIPIWVFGLLWIILGGVRVLRGTP
jgi:hypothetical protein